MIHGFMAATTCVAAKSRMVYYIDRVFIGQCGNIKKCAMVCPLHSIWIWIDRPIDFIEPLISHLEIDWFPKGNMISMHRTQYWIIVNCRILLVSDFWCWLWFCKVSLRYHSTTAHCSIILLYTRHCITSTFISTIFYYRIKGWWLAHHFITTAAAGVFLVWWVNEYYTTL